jgi:hypothetical protein
VHLQSWRPTKLARPTCPKRAQVVWSLDPPGRASRSPDWRTQSLRTAVHPSIIAYYIKYSGRNDTAVIIS